ncbi:MAG: tryptophan synthase subunit beta like protein [Sedimenticolaceae bacterium]
MHQVFILHDKKGNISSLSAEAAEGAVAVSIEDPEVQAFLRNLDVDLVRVLEDVVDLLVARGVFRFTDLPQSAQHKLLFRKNLRSQWQAVPDPLGSEDGLF